MKLLNIISVCVVLICSSIYAEPYIHISGGLNLSSMSYTDYTPETNDMRIGFNCGLRFEQKFTDHFSFLTGFSFETRGQTQAYTVISSPTVTQNIEEEINLFYLQVPFIAQFNLPIGPILNIVFFGGPDMGASLAAEKNIEKTITPQGGSVVIENDTVKLARNISMLDFGVIAGVACELNIGSFGAIYVRPEYYLGLIDFINEKKAGGEESVNVGKNRNIGINIGVKVRFGKE